MNYIFLSKPSSEYLSQIKKLFAQIEFSSIEQYPGFSEAAYIEENIVHGLMYSANELVGYAQLKIKKKLLACVYFGPLVKNQIDYSAFVIELKKYCKCKFIPILKIFPPLFSNQYLPAFWDQLKTDTGFDTSSNGFNWATLILNINDSEDSIYKNFADNHRSSIKKALKLNLTTALLDKSEIEEFNLQYCQMFIARGINISIKSNLEKFSRLYHFFKENKSGFFMGVKFENKIVGGVCIAFGNNVAFYLEGYSNPNYRKLPISHIALFDAIKFSKKVNYNYFDFGGYALNIKEEDQLFNINKFKKDFKGELINYPLTLEIFNIPVIKWLFRLYKKKLSIY